MERPAAEGARPGRTPGDAAAADVAQLTLTSREARGFGASSDAKSSADALDYAPFYDNAFNPQAYAGRFLGQSVLRDADHAELDSEKAAGPTERQRANARLAAVDSDLNVAVSRLSLAINEVDQKIHELVTTHAPDFLAQLECIRSPLERVDAIHAELGALESRAAQAQEAVRAPLQQIRTMQSRLERIQSVARLVNDAQRTVALGLRLEGQMNTVLDLHLDDPEKNKDLDTIHRHAADVAAAASTLAAMRRATSTLDDGSEDPRGMQQLEPLAPLVALLPTAQELLSERVETHILYGLRTLSPSLLGNVLQAAYDLGVLDNLVGNLLEDLSGVIVERIRLALDLRAIGKEIGETHVPTVLPFLLPASYKARRPQHSASHEAATASTDKWTSAVYRHLHALIVEEMSSIFGKVQMLERVLQLKRTHGGEDTFLEMTARNLGDEPTHLLWSLFARNFETFSNQCMEDSPFWRHVFTVSYPKLLRIFHELFARISGSEPDAIPESVRPRSISSMLASFERAYLEALTNKASEGVEHLRVALSSGNGATQGIAEARTMGGLIATELDASCFDSRLVENVAGVCAIEVREMLSQSLSLVRREESVYSLQHRRMSAGQLQNIRVANALHVLIDSLSSTQMLENERIRAVCRTWQEGIQNAIAANVLDPWFESVKRDLYLTLSRIHRFKLDRASTEVTANIDEAEASAYMLEFRARISVIQEDLLSRLHVGQQGVQWMLRLAKHAFGAFALHASLIRVLQESEKLQLTTDMTALELGLAQLLSEASRTQRGRVVSLADCGEAFSAVREFRALLFASMDELKKPDVLERIHVPKLVLLQHLLSRSISFPQPNEMRKSTKTGYVEWLLATADATGHLVSADASSAVIQSIRAWLDERKVKGADTNDKDPTSRTVLATLSYWVENAEQV